jgi:mRNA (2'-O-methyladenosine-N6-)-methyltransferase
MSDVKRGSASNYDTMTVNDIKNLEVPSITADDAVLALWVPGSLLVEGLDVMKEWGFTPKQTHVWVKTKKEPFKDILNVIKRIIKHGIKSLDFPGLCSVADKDTKDLYASLCMNGMLAFGMGRLFRQTHEICLIGTRGKPYQYLKDKAQRSVHFGPVIKHSGKPEDLQDMLERMFPRVKKVELFARRDRKGWTCMGLECPSTLGEDIRVSINALTC